LRPTVQEIIFLQVVSKQAEGLTPAPPLLTSTDWPRASYRTHADVSLAKHPIYANQMQASMEAELKQALRSELRDFQDAGFKVEAVIKFGDPAHEILDYIEEEKIDLVAMTTHGRTGLTRLIYGSVAEKVLHKIKVPVLLLRPVASSQHLQSEEILWRVY
jgi:nucleotide-binding universal stress UspA family protein